MRSYQSISLVFLILGILILLEQYIHYNVWFEIKDIHHETWALISFALSLGITVGYKLNEMG